MTQIVSNFYDSVTENFEEKGTILYSKYVNCGNC